MNYNDSQSMMLYTPILQVDVLEHSPTLPLKNPFLPITKHIRVLFIIGDTASEVGSRTRIEVYRAAKV